MSDKQENGKQDKRNPDSEVPAGFTTRVGRERGDGWLKKEVGQIIEGRLLGHYVMKGQQNDDGSYRSFYQIRISPGCSYTDTDGKQKPGVRAIFQDDNKDKHDVILTEGQILNVDNHKALEEMSPFARDGGTYDVWFKYLKEEEIMRGRRKATFWRVKGPLVKTIVGAKHPPRPMALRPGPGSNEDSMAEDDIPF